MQPVLLHCAAAVHVNVKKNQKSLLLLFECHAHNNSHIFTLIESYLSVCHWHDTNLSHFIFEICLWKKINKQEQMMNIHFDWEGDQ